MSLRSLGDARIIRDLAHAVEDVVILGGGFIGLEVAATLAQGGSTVTVLEAQDRLLGRVVAPEISAHVATRLAATGIAVMTGVAIDGFDGVAGRVAAVRLSDGRRIAAGMVVVGIGVVPNTELAQTAALGSGSGIPVDLQMRSSVPEILAIGDLATYRHWSTGADVRLESVQNAHDQAKLAARTVTGHADAFQSVPWFWSDIGDMKLQMVGLPTGSDDAVLVGEPGDNRFALFRYRGERLVSIETVNRPGDHMLGRKMIACGLFAGPPHARRRRPEGDLRRLAGDGGRAWQRPMSLTVATSWYETTRIDAAITHITEPFANPYIRANIWHCRGRDADLLVDTGMGLAPLSPHVETGGRPLIVVATHIHVDHVGGLHEFSERLGPARSAEAFATMHDGATLAHMFRRLDEPVSQLPGDGWTPDEYRIAPAPLTRMLAEGDVIDLGDRRFTVMELPGHSHDSIGLFDEADGTFFSGDAIYDDELIDDLPDSDRAAYRRTMQRLKRLPVRIAHGGHGPSFDGRRLTEIADAYLAATDGT